MKKVLFFTYLLCFVITKAHASGHVATAQGDGTCSGVCTGHLSGSVSGGTGPFSFVWSPGGMEGQSVSDVCAGVYTLTVTDSSDMSVATASFTVMEYPAISITLQTTNPTMCGACDGSIIVNTTGGTPAYTYSINGTPGFSQFQNLCAGPYIVQVSDMAGCTAVAYAELLDPTTGITSVTYNYTDPTACNVCDGTLSVNTITGGSGQYTYSWSLNAGYFSNSQQALSGLCPGIYSLNIMDENFCSYNSPGVTLEEPNHISVVLAPQNPTACGLCDGSIGISNITGGTGQYSYLWAPNGYTTNSLTGLCAGSYSLTVTDEAGCMASSSRTLTVNNPITIILDTIINVNCADNNGTGSITVHATGGVSPYTYSWSPGAQTTASISNLPVGNYSVSVADANGCVKHRTLQVVNTYNLYAGISTVSANCTNNGSATVTAQGGTPPYSYLWNDPGHQTSATATGLAPGNYSVTITDGIGCTRIAYCHITTGCNSIVRGRVYYDENQNCVQDNGEQGLAGWYVRSVPGNFYAYTDMNGDYSLPTSNLTNTVSVVISNNSFIMVCPLSGSISVNFSQFGDTLFNNDFALYADPAYVDLGVYANYGFTRPGFPKNYSIYYINRSPLPHDATLRFVYDPALIFTSAPGGVHSLPQHSIEWSLSNIPPAANPYLFLNKQANFTVPQNLPIGTPLHTYMEILPIAGDAYPPDNTISIVEHVTGAYDPNDKSVLPRGEGPEGYILEDDSLFYYTINFQNTGNDTAFTVVITDTLSAYLDPGTVAPGASSHPYTFDLTAQGIITFRFDAILLPDSNMNEPASHGFVNYSVKKYPDMPLGTEIENTAYIYFDFNEAIVTNTTKNTITDVITGIKNVADGSNVQVYPNPFSESTLFIVTLPKGVKSYSFELYDMLGEQVKYRQNISSDRFTVSRSSLSSGIYFYKLFSSGNVIGAGKLVIE